MVAIKCEADGSPIQITCPDSYKIDIIYANFGRTVSSSQTCHHNSHADVTTCNRDQAVYMQTAKSLCQNKSSCQVQRLHHLGDPCPGTYKYLEVRYSCNPGKYKMQTMLCLVVKVYSSFSTGFISYLFCVNLHSLFRKYTKL